MKFNKWTLGLAAVGAVSMASAVRADETAHLDKLNTALSSTTISGYVDVAAQWNAGDQPQRNAIYVPVGGISSSVDTGRKVDNFSLNNVTITLDKPLDESPWAAGYHVDLNAGQDAFNAFGWDINTGGVSTSSTLVGVRQAYVTLRTPVGNGIDWKIGALDGVTGYEANTGYLNPNYTRSYGYAVNPASMVGLLGNYKICNEVAVNLGIVNRGTSFGSYGQNARNLSSKDYVATIAFTAPESFGFLKGSVLNLGTVQGFDNNSVNNYSASATLNTPVTGLKFGLAFDTVQSLVSSVDGNIYGVYLTYQATDKLSLNLRGEYVDSHWQDLSFFSEGYGRGEEITTTLEYDMWANVVSRLEFRWDHVEQGTQYATVNGSVANAFQVALNVVYKF